ncbi:hypothetical protein H0S68_25025 (plasmid) [Serratia sp. AXJ-M]|uniref:hypothetical protein n=1 Tax=Serratia sp. AXJ-M TaxID=2754727 RepID=UPI003977FEF4
MNLYHYTGVTMLHGILTSEGINRGYLQLSDGKMLYGHSWYTTSPLPYGHGLSDGTEMLNQNDKDFARKAAGGLASDTVHSLHNKRLIRLSVDTTWLKQQEGFYSFRQILRHYGQSALYGKALAVSGWVDQRTLSDTELLRWMKSPKLKHDTWYVHTGTLPPDRILSVEYMEKPDIYVPYDFELHGRRQLEKSGFFCITASENNELNTAASNTHYLPGSIFVICPHPDAPPAITFRKSGGILVLSINNGKKLQEEGVAFSEEAVNKLSTWAMNKTDSLMGLWEKSKENWHRFNN